MKHYNKREKTANLLFKVVEYGLIAFGINALLPDTLITPKILLIGGGVILLLFIPS